MPPSIWNLSSPARDRTHVPCIDGGFLTDGPPEKFLHISQKIKFSFLPPSLPSFEKTSPNKKQERIKHTCTSML